MRRQSGRSRRPVFLGTLLAAACLSALAPAPALAAHHFMKVREVFPSVPDQSSVQFVELQMHATGQNVVSGRQLVVYDAAGTVIGAFTFPVNVANGANQSTILIATAQAASFFGVTPNLTIAPVLPAAGGKVCWERPSPFMRWDCVAWGSYSGPDTGTGNPFSPAFGLMSGISALRDISANNPALLEAADDTDDSAADFDLASPTPRNNAGATTTTAGQVDNVGGSLQYNASAGSVANEVTVSGPAGGFYTVRDRAAPVMPGAGCEAITVIEVRCDSIGVTDSALELGPGNDAAAVSTAFPSAIAGGTGNDRLTGGDGSDALDGGDGIDTLTGGEGSDTLNGGADSDTVTYAERTGGLDVDIDGEADDGNAADGPVGARDNVATDVENLIGGRGADALTGRQGPNSLDGGAGPDELNGLRGVDTANYAVRTGSIVADIDGVADDGSAADEGPGGERDNVALDVENLIGGKAADTLTGSAAANNIDGGAGADAIAGGDGIDAANYTRRSGAVVLTLDGTADDGSAADGPAGARDNIALDVENLFGGKGADTLIGSVEANRLVGGRGADTSRGFGGDDTLIAKDGVVDAMIDCDGAPPAGAADVATVDGGDPATANCETVTP